MNPSNDSGKDKSQRIEALEFEAPGAGAAGSQSATDYSNTPASLTTRSGAPWWQSQFNLMLAVFGLLAVAALLFVSLTPAPSATSASTTIVAPDGSSSVAAAPPPETPWDETRRAQARSDSQDILSSLLESKKKLEAKGVQTWAANRYEAALARAAQGDEFYKRQDYQQAIESYQAAAEQMDNLNELVPDIVKGKVAEGMAAIKDGKSALAKEKFNEALALDANNISALSGLDRAGSLDRVIEITNAALRDEQAYQGNDSLDTLMTAKQKYQEALAIDASAVSAVTGQRRVDEMIVDKQYRDAMSQGYRALFSGRYSAAKSSFSSALKFRPGDATARAAYRQSLASDSRSSLGSLLAEAAGYERNERWSSALSNYQVVLQRDPNQVDAKLGKIRSQARAELDKRIADALSDKLSLSKSTQRDQVQSVLADAKAISRKGSVLTQQIAELESALQQADTKVKVTLVSDALTDVRLKRAGAREISLGKFAKKNLAIKPGRYVVSGTRLGFRDVRREVSLMPGQSEVELITIRCEEPVGAQLSSAKPYFASVVNTEPAWTP